VKQSDPERKSVALRTIEYLILGLFQEVLLSFEN